MGKRRPTPYWTGVFKEAQQRMRAGDAPFTSTQERSAAMWQTCACGRQDPRIPRTTNAGVFDGVAHSPFAPTDNALRREGMAFSRLVIEARRSWREGSRRVARNLVKRAREAMIRIEQRAAIVLDQVRAA